MRELVFAIEFKENAEPVPGATNRLRAKTAAKTQTLRSVLTAEDVHAGIEPTGGDAASFESEVEVTGDGASPGSIGNLEPRSTKPGQVHLCRWTVEAVERRHAGLA